MSTSVQIEAEPVEVAWSSAFEADSLAVSLQAHADRLALPIAAAAQAFVGSEAWNELGYARQSDYARERVDRTSRWLRQMAALGRALAGDPQLAAAMTGDDGKPPIGLSRPWRSPAWRLLGAHTPGSNGRARWECASSRKTPARLANPCERRSPRRDRG